MQGLNPCCNGYGFLTLVASIYKIEHILSLNPCCNGYGFLTVSKAVLKPMFKCLNPCCNGYGFLTKTGEYTRSPAVEVLILVVMDMGF